MSALSISDVDLAPFVPAPAVDGPGRSPASRGADFPHQVARQVPQLEVWARRLTHHRADADDLVQETCRRALEARSQFVPGSNLRAWMMSILRNHHVDRMRQSWREVTSAEALDEFPANSNSEPADLAEMPVWTRVTQQDIDDALASLPAVFADAYSLYAMSGLSYNEIAERLSIPAATVGTRLRRARLRLRSFLERRLASRPERRWD